MREIFIQLLRIVDQKIDLNKDTTAREVSKRAHLILNPLKYTVLRSEEGPFYVVCNNV